MRKQALIDKILEQSERPESGESPLQETSPRKLRKATIRCRKNGKDAKDQCRQSNRSRLRYKAGNRTPDSVEPFFAENAAGKEKNRKTRHAPETRPAACGGRNGTIPEREKTAHPEAPAKTRKRGITRPVRKKQNGTRPEKKPDRLYETGNADGGSERRCKTTRP